jgi:hypothetical protein
MGGAAMHRVGLVLGQIILALLTARADAQPTAEQVRALEAKICTTPAQSIDLSTAARSAATGSVPMPVPGIVLPAAEKLKPGEARFVALSVDDEQVLSDFAKTQQPPGVEASLFRGAFRTLSADQLPVTLKAVAFARAPLRFNAHEDRFEGRVSVGVVSCSEGTASKLAAAIPFQLLGEVGATPATFAVDHIGAPYGEIEVTTPALSCPIEVQVVSAVAPAAVSLSLTALPALRVRARPTRIRGFGLASAELIFELVGPRHGLTGDARLSTTLGRLSGSSFQLLSGHARAELRSRRIGLATLTVAGPGLDPGNVEIEFAFPWALLLAALAGGLVGAVLRRRLQLTRGEAVASTLLGLLAGVLYVWGMQQVELELPVPAGEIAVFVLAALGAYHGTRLYARIVGVRAS